MKKEKNENLENEEILEEQEPQEAGSAGEPPTININDLGLALNLISVAIKRGAYEPTELKTVGEIYEKIDSFVKWQVQLQQQQEAK